MNIQIYGTKKSNDTKKAERFFKERGVKFQFVDFSINAMSEGELNSIKKSLNMTLDDLVDESSKLCEKCFYKYLANADDKLDKVLDNQAMLKQPVVRNGKKATLGYCPEIWKEWMKE